MNSVLGFGSTGRIVADLASLAKEQGHESLVAFGRGEVQGGQIRISGRLGVLWHGLLTRVLDRHGLGSRLATWRLKRAIRGFRPDVVHLHNLHGYYVHYPDLLGYLAKQKLPVLLTLHDCWTLTGHCSHFDFSGCQKWLAECSDCPQKKEYPRSDLVDRSRKNHVDKKRAFAQLDDLTIVTPSRWLQEQVLRSHLGTRTVRVVPNGIDDSVFCPPRADHDKLHPEWKGKFVVLAVASIWTPNKGLAELLAILERLPSSSQLVVVGKRNALGSEDPRVCFIDRTANIAEMAALYQRADVFVNPTLEDTFPTTNLEALACGTPVVTYRTGGSPESVPEGAGHVVPRGDREGLVEAIALVEKRGKTAYSQFCAEHARTHYRKADRYADYIRLYAEISQEHQLKRKSYVQ